MTVEILSGNTWFDITPWIAWQGLTFSRNDIDAPYAGRDMSGTMHRGRVAIKEKMNITTRPLTRNNVAALETLIAPEYFQVRVTPYPKTNAAHVMTMYSNNVSKSYVIFKERWDGMPNEDFQTVKFPLIEM